MKHLEVGEKETVWATHVAFANAKFLPSSFDFYEVQLVAA